MYVTFGDISLARPTFIHIDKTKQKSWNSPYQIPIVRIPND